MSDPRTTTEAKASNVLPSTVSAEAQAIHDTVPPPVLEDAIARGEATTRDALAPPNADAVRRAAKLALPPPVLPRASRLRAARDWLLFLLFVAIGFVAIFVLKLSGVNALIVAILAGTAMVAYGVLAYFRPAVPMRPDKLGDNIYYMGFVFTLASMSAALVELERGTDVSRLIGSFGVALLTTILGIVGRVTLLQMRIELEDVEEIARRDLLEYAERLRGQLSAAIGDLETFRLGVRNALEQRLQESLDTHQQAIERQLGGLEQLVTSALERLNGSFAVNETALAEMRQGCTRTVEELTGLWKRLAGIEVPSDILDRKLDAAMVRTDAVIQTFESTAKAETQRHEALATAAQDLSSMIATLSNELTHLNSVSAELVKSNRPAGQLASALVALNKQVQAVGTAMKEQEETSRSAVESARGHEAALTGTLAASRAKLSELQEMVSEASADVAGAAQKAGTEMRIASEAFSAHRDVVVAAAQDAENARRKIASDLAASRELLVELQRLLVQAARPIPVELPTETG